MTQDTDAPVCPPRPGRSAIIAALTGSLLLAAAPTFAQDYIQSPCAGARTPRFEDHLQSLWYRRFWTGDCKNLPALRCRSGRPYWNDVVRTLSARAPAAQRSSVASRACQLGRRIGFEWTRPSAERRIDTNDLRGFAATLEKASDVSSGLAAVEGRVRAKIGA